LKSFQTYPDDLEKLEAAAIWNRRAIVAGSGLEPMVAEKPVMDAAGAQGTAQAVQDAAETEKSRLERLPTDAIGLGLSGGGMRSSTFCLGVLQAFAQRGLLRHVDFLSTVSGGGYVGGFLGRFYDRLRGSPVLAADIVEAELANSSSAPISWLRNHGEFIAPAGKTDLRLGAAIFLRNIFTLQLVLFLLAFAVYGIANFVRYGLANPVTAIVPYVNGMSWTKMPLGRLVWSAADISVLWSPWFILVELLLLLRLLPIALAYWLASQDDDEAYSRPTLVFAFLVLFGLLYLSVRNGLNVTALVGAFAIILAFPSVERAWWHVRQETRAVGSGGPRIKQLRARTHLSFHLGVWLAITGTVLFFALVDTFGHALFRGYGQGNREFVRTLAWLSGGIVTLLPILRGIGRKIADVQSKGPSTSSLGDVLSGPVVSGVLATLLLVPPVLVVSYISHAAFGGGNALWRGTVASGFALLLSFVIALPWAIMLINRTSLQATYAARIARAFLGASNPHRTGPAGDDVLPGDDVDKFTDYRPHAAGGPLHLINVCINQTVDPDTLRSARERKGMGMACSPLGVSINKYFHAKWNPDYEPKTPSIFRSRKKPHKSKQPLEALGHVTGTPHPLLGADGEPPDDIELLPLRDWIAISGGAFGPGMGSRTNPAVSILSLLANLRIGYWWNSGLTAGDRAMRPKVSAIRRILWLLPKLFETQTRLLAEAMAEFRGPWDRLWYLSDGGHFEMMGGYELVRRQVKFMIILDGSADFGDFANFQRMVRIDFQAEIVPLGKEDWAAAIADHVRNNPTAQAEWDALLQRVAVSNEDGGPFESLFTSAKDRPGAIVKKHAALFKVKYRSGEPSLLLHITASLSGDEPLDVTEYHAKHPDFPNESTTDQFFDEPQWESYRRLGEHVGDSLLGPKPANPPTTAGSDALWITRMKT
jgi:hypothetical protein